jgi:hypothetical protein
MGEEFWRKAYARPQTISKPLGSWKKELIRLEMFQQKLEACCEKRWTAKKFYIIWAAEELSHRRYPHRRIK